MLYFAYGFQFALHITGTDFFKLHFVQQSTCKKKNQNNTMAAL
jgi:hypothetical protein